MKKIIQGILALLLMIIFVVGCSNSEGKKNLQQSSSSQTPMSYYQNLNKADKKNVEFKFSVDQDETEDNSTDTVYAISVKITNKTDRIVKFDKSKFLVFATEDTKFTSNKKGILTLKPGQTKSIDQLIDKVSKQALVVDTSYFIYMNMNNKLAKTLTVVPKADRKKVKASTTNDSQSSVNDSSTDNNQPTTQNDNSSQNNAIPTEGQALARLSKGATDWDTSDLTAIRGNNNDCWVFDDSKGLTWIAYDNGMLKGPGDPHPVYQDDPHAYDADNQRAQEYTADSDN